MTTDVIKLDTDIDLFGEAINRDVQIDRELFAAGLTSLFRDISLEKFVSFLTNDVEAATDYVALCAGERTGQKISLLFNPHRLDTACSTNPVSLYASLKDEKFASGLARAMIFKYGKVKELLYQAIQLGINAVYYVGEFPPHIARDLALEYGLSRDSKVLDPCGGWGGRMIGFSTVVDSYTCCEPSSRTAHGLDNLNDFLRVFRSSFAANVCEIPFEDLDLTPETYDFALTSPPYYDTEWYAPNEHSNSYNRYPTFNAWVDGFYAPLIRRTMAALKPGAPFLLNIGSRKYPLNDLLKSICGSAFTIDKESGRLSGVAGFGKDGEGETFYRVRRVPLVLVAVAAPAALEPPASSAAADIVVCQPTEEVTPAATLVAPAAAETPAVREPDTIPAGPAELPLPPTDGDDFPYLVYASLTAKGHHFTTHSGKLFVSQSAQLNADEREAIKQCKSLLIKYAAPVIAPSASAAEVIPPILKDGAYRVTTPYLCAGFIVRNGTVARDDCAPILWDKLDYWKTIAKWSCDAPPAAIPEPEPDSLFTYIEPNIPHAPGFSIRDFLATQPQRETNWKLQEPPSLDGIRDIILNFETTGLQWWKKDRPLGLTVASLDGKMVRFLPFGFRGAQNLSEDTVKRWAQRELRGKHITNCSTKFEVHNAREWGIDLEEQGNTVSDVQHYAALIDDHRTKFNLDALATDYLGGVEIPRVDESHMVNHNTLEVAERAEYQAVLVSRLREKMWAKLDEEDLQRVRQLEDDVIFPTCEMEKNAAPIDVPLLKRWCAETESQQHELLLAVHKEVGFLPNPDSPDDWKKLFERFHLPITETAKGHVSFTDKILQAIDHPVIQKVRRAGKLASLRSKFLVSYNDAVGDDGLLRYHLHQLRTDDYGTVRGRYSASDKNIQQVFGKDGFMEAFDSLDYFVRKLFIAPPGRLFGAFDAAQIEFRIFSSYSGSKALLAAYDADPTISFHRVVWEMIKPYKPDIVYTKTKSLNFLSVYGGGKSKAAAFLDLPQAEADAFVDTYHRAFPEVKMLLRKAEKTAKDRGYVKSILGRRARFPDPNKAYAALNAVIQPTAADIFKTKIVQLHSERKYTGFTMRAPIHDELIGDVPDQESANRILEVLNRQIFPELKVPILWEGKAGATWADCK